MTDIEPIALDGASVTVSAAVHRPTRPHGAAVLLVHGAGGSFASDVLVTLAEIIADAGHLCIRANLTYRELGRRTPPAAERSVDDFAAIVGSARSALGPRRPWVVGGKSYGGRVASLAVAAGLDAAGLIFYGYPLHPPGHPERVRSDHWPSIRVPALFLQGTHDPFADLGLVRRHLPRYGGRAQLEVVEGGDHSLRVSRAASPDGRARPVSDVLSGLRDSVQDFLARTTD